jgi:hypothetical protein
MESTIGLVVFKGVHCVWEVLNITMGYSNGFFKCSMGLGDVFLRYSMSLEVLNVSLGYSMGFLNV